MALDLGVSLTVNTSSLEDAMKRVSSLGDAVNKIGKNIQSSAKDAQKSSENLNKSVQQSSVATEKAGKKTTSILERQRLIAQYLAGDFTKGEASILATGKAAGLTNKEMEKLGDTLKQIFKLSGKNPFDDSVDPLRRLTAESEKLVNKMKVLRGETTLTAKQLEELTIRQARVEASARANGIRGAALQSTINKATGEYITEAEKVNRLQAKYNLELENTKNNRKAEENVLRGISSGISGAIKQQEKLKKLVEETELKSRLMQQGLSTTTANMVVRAVRGGASETGSEVASLIASRKAIESVNESKKKLAETSSATYQAIVEGNKRAKFHIDGLQAAVRAVIPGFGALSAVAIGSTVIAGAIRMADAYRGLQERLKLVTSSEEERVSVSRRLLEISNANFQSLKETTELYVKLRPALAAVGGTQQQTLAVTDAFSKSLALSGANTREAAAATLQFAQAMGSGKLAGDEFRSISEAAPAVLQAIAAGTGKTTGELKKLASEGFLTTATVSKALLSQLTAIEIKFGILQPTISQSFNVLKNNTTDLIAQLDKATGFTNGIANSFLSIGNALGQVIPSIQSFGKVLSETSQFLSEAVIGITAYILVTQRAAIIYGTYKALLVTGIALEKSIIAVTAAKTAAIGAMTIATTTYTLAGKGFVGVLAVMAQGIGALTAALIRNPFMLLAAGVAALVATLSGDKIEKFFAGMGEKFSNFGTKVEEGTVKLEDGAKVLEKLQKELSLVQGGMSPEQAKLNLTSEQAITEEYKQRIEIANQFKGKDQERYIALLKEATLIKKSREDLQKLRTGENIKDPKVQTVESFNLGRINQEIEARLQGEKKTFDFRRDLIDKNLQYDLITAGVAEIQKQRLAEETYKRERALLQENIDRVNAVKNTGRSKEEQEEQEKQRKSRVEVLETQIKTLDIDRQRTLEIAKVVALGESERKSLQASTELAKIRADITEDITRKQAEFNSRFDDPSVRAAEQARLQAADKYTQKIVEAQQELLKIKASLDIVVNDEELLNQYSNDRAAILARINELLKEQALNSEKAAESAKNIVEQSRSIEEGFKRAFASFRDEQSDLSRVSENFAKGFFQEFDKAFMNIFESGKLNFSNLFDFIKTEIKKIAIQQLFLNPIKAAIAPLFSGVGSSAIGLITGGSVSATGISQATLGTKVGSTDIGMSINNAISSSNSEIAKTLGGSLGRVSIVFNELVSPIKEATAQLGIKLASSSFSPASDVGLSILQRMESARAAQAAGGTGFTATNLASGFVGSVIGSSISKGISNGFQTKGVAGFVSAAAPAIGASIGNAILPGIGGVIGGALGGLASGVFNRAFGSKTTVTEGASGVKGKFDIKGFVGRQFQDIIINTKKGFLRGGGGSTSVITKYANVPEQLQRYFNTSLKDLTRTITTAGSVLGKDVLPELSKFSLTGRFKISNEKSLNQTMIKVADEMVKRSLGVFDVKVKKKTVESGDAQGKIFLNLLRELRKAGESLAQVLVKVSSAVSEANTAGILLGKGTQFAMNNARDALNFQANVGELTKDLESVLQNFIPTATLSARRVDVVREQLRQLGLDSKVTVDTTREEFGKLLESVDIRTEAGQKELSVLLQIAPAIDGIIRQRESEAQALAEQAQATEQATAAIREQIEAQKAQRISELEMFSSNRDQFLSAMGIVQAGGNVLFDQEKFKIPGFASGGSFGGGLRIVGERGPELESTGPSRIFSLNQTRQILSGGSSNNVDSAKVAEELSMLREDMKASQTAIASLQNRMVRIFERWDGSGIPETRSVT